ncbi:hypothetical protein E1N52_34125 [Paraburkholderia guartelaensis]|uniref:Uncharacterized protein n=2 Tax=Paraburkholderia guartelaensis TaxID=2546446 RepID=A0A4R5L4C2_9BURK|nr:hypothetical protein E1N52_34125 [Paraburkholderia guartelaensis]
MQGVSFVHAGERRIPPSTARAQVPLAAFIQISLRNHLCVVALRSPHGKAFHLGTLVRTMFESFYLYEAGFGIRDVAVFAAVDRHLCALSLQVAGGASYFLDDDAFSAATELLSLYDQQIKDAPLGAIVDAHTKSKLNFEADEAKRMSIPQLVRRLQARRAMGIRKRVNV